MKQTGIKVRVQLTSYFAGDFLKGNNDNYMVRGLAGLRPAEQVRDALQPLADLAVERFGRKRGGKRLRIQITEQSAKGSAYLKQDGEAAASYNLGILGITAEEGSPLVDYLLAAAFGERRRDATELAVAWRRFESLPPLATEGGSSKPEGGSPEGEAPTATSGRAENGSNAVQPSSGEPKTGVGPGPYTFDADGCAPCHLPSLVGRLDGEVDPQKDLDFAWALDFVNEPDFSCNGEKDHMLRLARQWKARFPDHEVVVREGGCQDSPYAPDADQLGKVVALVGVAVSDAAPAQAGDLANPKTAPATETQIPENTVQPSGVPEGYDPDRDAVESMVESLRALGHGKLADLLINAGGTPKRELYRQAYDLVAGGEVVR